MGSSLRIAENTGQALGPSICTAAQDGNLKIVSQLCMWGEIVVICKGVKEVRARFHIDWKRIQSAPEGVNREIIRQKQSFCLTNGKNAVTVIEYIGQYMETFTYMK